MTVRRIGKTEVYVPRIGFGAAVIGNLYRTVTDTDAAAAIATACRAGITYFDTAPHYGFGLSERRLGSVLQECDPQSLSTVSTKVGRLLVPVEPGAPRERHAFVDAEPYDPLFDYSYDAVMRSYEDSRKRLRRERIDILLAHDLGELTHGQDHDRRFAEFMEGGYRAMRALRDSGAVGAIGLGANETSVCQRAMRAGDFDVFLLAGRYTLLEQGALDEFLPECGRRGVSVIIGGPYNSGILVEGTRSAGPLHYNYEAAPEAVIERVRRLEEVCVRHSVELPAAALQFPLHHPQVASVIPGLATPDEVRQALDWAGAHIPQLFWQELKEEGLLHPDAPEPMQ